MENKNDEEIQRLIEEQLKGAQLPGNVGDKDVNLYRLLFTELAKEPLEIKNRQLAENVVRQILAEQERRAEIYYGLVIAAIIIFITGLTYFTMARVDVATLNTIMQFLIANKMVILFILLTFCLIQVLDKHLIKRNTPLNRN